MVKGLIDTGSGNTILSKKFADQAKLKIKPLESDDFSVLFAANGGKLHVLGLADIQFYISGLCIPHTVYVVDNVSETQFLDQNIYAETKSLWTLNWGLSVFVMI